MKKMVSILLALALSLSLLCTGVAEGVTGTYEGAAYGNNADVRVAVTFDGGVITDEESDKITSSFHTGVKIFIGLVAVVVVLSIGVAVYNAVIEHKRRKRRRNRRRSR